MNKAILIGNLANNPESSATASGISKCTFRLAVQRRYANQQGEREADFLNIVCWRQTADHCRQYLAKGSKVCVEGSIQNRSYEAQDGSKRYITEIIADRVEFLSRKDDGAGTGRNDTNEQSAQQKQQPTASQSDFTAVEVDDLPF